jgi:DNA primase
MSSKQYVVDLLTEHLGQPKETTSDEVCFNSPFTDQFENSNHADRKYHLYVNPKREVFCCYKSGLKGGLKYLYKLLGIDIAGAQSEDSDPSPSLEKLWQKLDNIQKKAGKFEIPKAELPDWYTPAQPGSAGWAYLIGRGVSEADIAWYRIGQGTGRHFHEIIIPTFNSNNECEYWVIRNIYKKVYLNPKVPRKYHVGFLHLATQYSPKSIIVAEGCFSAIAAGRDAVCTYGKLVTTEQLQRIRRAGVEELTLALDPDALKETYDSAERSLSLGFKVNIVFLPKGYDPADLGYEIFREYFYDKRVPVTRATLLRLRAQRLV